MPRAEEGWVGEAQNSHLPPLPALPPLPDFGLATALNLFPIIDEKICNLKCKKKNPST
jgi:hypothetical protein